LTVFTVTNREIVSRKKQDYPK